MIQFILLHHTSLKNVKLITLLHLTKLSLIFQNANLIMIANAFRAFQN
jgi:hypothetical protein